MTQLGRHMLKQLGHMSSVVTLTAGLSLAPMAMAQSSDIVPAGASGGGGAPTDGLNLNLGGSSGLLPTLNLETDFSGLDISGLNTPVDALGSTLFQLDLADPDCLIGEGPCLRRSDNLDIGLTTSFVSLSKNGLDLSLTPRASVRFNDGSNSAVVGAMVEIGKNLRDGADFKPNTWYLFAGADAEALTYSTDAIRRLNSGQFHLQDRIIVGDAQAGLGYRIGDADVSLSYLRRKATAEEFSFSEDAAALSFTWKR